MLHKVAELGGAMLDAAVAKADGGGLDPHRPAKEMQLVLADGRRVLAGPQSEQTKQHEWSPCTHWEHAGPIIDGWRVDKLTIEREDDGGWSVQATMRTAAVVFEFGRTQLEALMRAYVASQYGDTVEIP